ncbi:MAG: hypothetical protein KIS96_01265 [Bauldia sp.]|nr:hypothetical protein [Bauldia sp.]
MKSRLPLALLASAVIVALPAAAQDAVIVFPFEAIASRNASFDRSAYTYPDNHDLAGQVNANAGDVGLDGVVIDGETIWQSGLQFVSAATIVVDDATDTERGGHNVATGYGIGADLDGWVDEGVGSTTPDADALVAAQGNFNLTSITAVRENVGTVVYELSFETPTDTLLLFERGNSGDILVAALDEAGNEVASILVLDGANDGDGAVSAYTPTGIVVTTFVQDGFLNQGQQLSSVGLRFPVAATTFRFTALQEAEGDGAVRYNGPDLKVLALASGD